MAIWQYPLIILPKKAVFEKFGEIPDCLFIDNKGWKKYWENLNLSKGFPEPDFDDAKTMKWWKNIELNIQEVANQIDELVKRGDWSNDMDFIGWKGDTEKEEDNDCHIAYDEKTNEISEFQFRTDLRNMEKATRFLTGMLEICSNNKLLLMNTEGLLFEPKMELIFMDLEKSDAVKFLTDSEKFLDEISNDEENRIQFYPTKPSFWDRIRNLFN